LQSTPSSKAAGPDAGFLLSGNRLAKIVGCFPALYESCAKVMKSRRCRLFMLNFGAIMLENSIKPPWKTAVGVIATEFIARYGA
jgi:hypothetical protein